MLKRQTYEWKIQSKIRFKESTFQKKYLCIADKIVKDIPTTIQNLLFIFTSHYKTILDKVLWFTFVKNKDHWWKQ